MISEYFLGPYYCKGDTKRLVTFRDSVEKFLSEVASYRSKETYKHSTCTGIL